MKISNTVAYKKDDPTPSLTDYLIGTDTLTNKKTTKNFSLQKIKDLILSGLNTTLYSNVIKNIGSGKQLFKGTNVDGEKEFRTLLNSDNLIKIEENTETVDIGIEINNFITFIQANVGIENIGSGVGIYNDAPQIITPQLKTLTESGDLINILPNADTVDFSINEDVLEQRVLGWTSSMDVPWITMVLQEVTAISGLTQLPQYRKKNGTLEIRGNFGTLTSGNKLITILPTGYRPVSDQLLYFIQHDGSLLTLTISNTTGEMRGDCTAYVPFALNFSLSTI